MEQELLDFTTVVTAYNSAPGLQQQALESVVTTLVAVVLERMEELVTQEVLVVQEMVETQGMVQGTALRQTLEVVAVAVLL